MPVRISAAADDLAMDLDRARRQPLPLGLTCLNVAWTGVRLHAENIWRDIAFAARVLSKAPVFVAVAFLTIALATAANVVAFSALKGVLMDPLPYARADRLGFISRTTRGQDETNIDYPDVRDFAERSRLFSGIAVEAPAHATLTGMGRPVEVPGWYVGGSYFSVLGERAQIGRLISAGDAGTRRVVISDSLWRTRFGASATVLGRRLILSEHAYTIVGVAPHLLSPGAGFMAASDYWIPIVPRTANFRGNLAFYAVGRLRDGVTFAQAQADLSRIMVQLVREYPNGNTHRGVRVRPLSEVLTGPIRMLVLMLYGAAVLVLLIAAANITNLLFVRAAARDRDFVIRSALGATKKRIAMQLTLEMALISTSALVAAIALAWWCLTAATKFLSGIGKQYGMNMAVPGWEHVGLNAAVIAYAVALTLLFTLAVAALPAYARGRNLAALLNAAGRSFSAGRRRRAQVVLVICELVLAFTVVCIAALLLESFMRLERTPAGFAERNVYAIAIDLPSSKRYTGYGALHRFYARTEKAFQALPGVGAAGEAFIAGLGSQSRTDYSLTRPLGVKAPAAEPEQIVETNSVSPQFFSTLEIPLLRGRVFAASDTESSQAVAVVSRSFAIAHFGSMSGAIGKYVSIGDTSDGRYPLRRIIGVVGDVRHFLSDPPQAEVYAPLSQLIYPGEIVVRTNGDDPHLASDLTAALAKIDPLLAPPQVDSFLQMRSLNELITKISATAFLTIAAIALLLALAGVYGVVAYGVERRTQEFGIRMSLGVRAAAIAAGVIRRQCCLRSPVLQSARCSPL